MGISKKLSRAKWFIRWTNWEYLPMYITNLPVIFIWLYFALRARNLFFFSAVNPVIETGGVLGESKKNILQRLPTAYLPKTCYFSKNETIENIWQKLQKSGMELPFIAKPDIGERGFLVSKIESREDLQAYLDKNPPAFIIQEFIDWPLELSILYHRFPHSSTGAITSICKKEFLKVKGDGTSTLKDLMEQSPRASLQIERIEVVNPAFLSEMPPKGEEVLIEPIGNHCRGTTFLNGNNLIDREMTKVFDSISLEIDDIYYGRFDLKCRSIEDLKKGEFRILEFNGIAGEPAHIYDPSYPVLKKYRDIYLHWNIIFNIYKIQRKRGIAPMTLKEALRSLRQYIRYKNRFGNSVALI